MVVFHAIPASALLYYFGKEVRRREGDVGVGTVMQGEVFEGDAAEVVVQERG